MANLVVPATPLGNVMPLPKGEWIAGVTYKPLNIIKHKNSTYIALLENAAEPSGDTDANWMLVVRGVPIATTESAGKVKPDGSTITVDEDGTIHGAKQVPDNVLVAVEIGEDDPDLPDLQAPPIDADRLGGELPEYFATAESVTDILAKIGELDDLSTTEKETIVAALNELFTDAGKLGTNVEEVKNQLKSAGLNSYNLGGTSKWDNIAKSTSLPLTFFTNWTNDTEFPAIYGSGVIIPALDGTIKFIIYVGSNGGATANRNMWLGYMKFSDTATYTITWNRISDENSTSNPNILINSNFKDPVNQRGQTTYTGANGYTIDRWQFNASPTNILTINDGYITLSCTEAGISQSKNIWQNVENYKDFIGKTLTYTVKIRVTSGKAKIWIDMGSGSTVGKEISSSNDWQIVSVTGVVGSDVTRIRVENQIPQNYNNAIDLEWAKLEVGDMSTIYTPPNKAEELVKCQWFYQKLGTIRVAFLATGSASHTVSNAYPITSMRVTPTFSASKIDIPFRINTPWDSNKMGVHLSKEKISFDFNTDIGGYNVANNTVDIIDVTLDAEIY